MTRPTINDQAIKDLIDAHQAASFDLGWRAGFCSAAVAVLVPLAVYALYSWVYALYSWVVYLQAHP